MKKSKIDNMIQKIKRNLIIWNTIITSTILSVVVLGICYINITRMREDNIKQFIELQDKLVNKLQNEFSISNEWLSKMEIDYNAVIYIEDNGAPFFFEGSWIPPVSRNIMIKKAKKKALEEGIDTTKYVYSTYKNSSSVFTIKDKKNASAYCAVCNIPVRNGYMSLTLLQFHPHEKALISKQIILYVGGDLLGCFALFLVSCFFVGKALKPAVESQKRQNEFIAAASHDLRSPLTVIQTNATALLIDKVDNKRFVPKIVEECRHMSRLISDMLILASSDVKTWNIQYESIDTESYLIDLYDTYYELCKNQDHILTLELPEEALPRIQADKGRLTQVIGILIDNAISYSPAGSTIILRPYIKRSVFLLEVEDHGCGISKEQKEKIFDRFYRVDKSRNDNTHFGLGLSIAKELIELQRGRISVKDVEKKGATFVIELPLS